MINRRKNSNSIDSFIKTKINCPFASEESHLTQLAAPYLSFVQQIITVDHRHIGSVSSIVQGTRNSNKLFFNISGSYRYCPVKRNYHQRSSTSIIIDMSTNCYAIRCKDPKCDNSKLKWNHIDSFHIESRYDPVDDTIAHQ